jgi:hypothetical protein
MRGMPEPMKVWSWHLTHLPAFRRRVPATDQVRLRVLGAVAATAEAGSRSLRGAGAGRFAARTGSFVRNQTYVHVSPIQLFGLERCPLGGTLDRILLVTSRDDPAITVTPITGDEVAQRMRFSNQHERLDFVASYLRFRFAFPDRSNEVIERLEAREREALRRVLADIPAHAVQHPYPIAVPDLYAAIAPVIQETDGRPPDS